jgi:hypothetical protein
MSSFEDLEGKDRDRPSNVILEDLPIVQAKCGTLRRGKDLAGTSGLTPNWRSGRSTRPGDSVSSFSRTQRYRRERVAARW